jgi:hypothetical protein
VTLVISWVLLHQKVGAAGVSECYACNDSCSTPLEIVSCPAGGAFSCIYAKNDITGEVARACISDSDYQTRRECELIDQVEGSYCYICETDLCNFTATHAILTVLPLCFVVVLRLF